MPNNSFFEKIKPHIAAIMLICHEEHIDDKTAGIIINSNFFNVGDGNLNYMGHVGKVWGKVDTNSGKDTDILTIMREA